MAFTVSPPPPPTPPPPLEAVSDELEKAADEIVDAVEDLLEQASDAAADELTGNYDEGLATVQQGLAESRSANSEAQRVLAEIVDAASSFIQDRQQDAQRLGADATTVTLIMIAVVIVVIALVGAGTTGGYTLAIMATIEALISAGRLGARAAGDDAGHGSRGRGPASADGNMEALLLRVKNHLRELSTSRDRRHTRLLVLKAILNALNALSAITARSRHARAAAAVPPSPGVRLALGRLLRCMTRLEARLRIRNGSAQAQAALSGLTRMRGSLAATAHLVKPPVVQPAGPGSNARPPHQAPRVTR